MVYSNTYLNTQYQGNPWYSTLLDILERCREKPNWLPKFAPNFKPLALNREPLNKIGGKLGRKIRRPIRRFAYFARYTLLYFFELICTYV